VQLHREAWGGEKFFDMLERISQDRPATSISFSFNTSVLLRFAGKYQVQERGHEHLLEVQQDLYRKILNKRGPTERDCRSCGSPLIPPESAHSVLAVVGSRRGRHADTRHHVNRVLREPRLLRRSLMRNWRGRTGGFSPAHQAAPVRGPTLKQLLAID